MIKKKSLKNGYKISCLTEKDFLYNQNLCTVEFYQINGMPKTEKSRQIKFNSNNYEF
jgi:hypothetical protein